MSPVEATMAKAVAGKRSGRWVDETGAHLDSDFLFPFGVHPSIKVTITRTPKGNPSKDIGSVDVPLGSLGVETNQISDWFKIEEQFSVKLSLTLIDAAPAPQPPHRPQRCAGVRKGEAT